jgi:Aldehyde dehydrogenase family
MGSGLASLAHLTSTVRYISRVRGHNPISQIVEPVTGTIISSVANLDRQDFIKAIEAASAAQKSYYKSTTAAQRGELLRKWYNLIIANKKDCKCILFSHYSMPVLTQSSGEDTLPRKWEDICRSRRRGDICREFYIMVLGRGNSSIRRHHSFPNAKYYNHNSETTSWRLWDHYSVIPPFSCG